MADEKFDPTKMPPFDPSKMPAFDPSKMPKDFDPSKLPPMPKMEEPETNTTETENLLKQEDPARWLRQPPKKIRGDMRMAMAYGREAEKYKCTCWNKGCPFYGNCRKGRRPEFLNAARPETAIPGGLLRIRTYTKNILKKYLKPRDIPRFFTSIWAETSQSS